MYICRKEACKDGEAIVHVWRSGGAEEPAIVGWRRESGIIIFQWHVEPLFGFILESDVYMKKIRNRQRHGTERWEKEKRKNLFWYYTKSWRWNCRPGAKYKVRCVGFMKFKSQTQTQPPQHYCYIWIRCFFDLFLILTTLLLSPPLVCLLIISRSVFRLRQIFPLAGGNFCRTKCFANIYHASMSSHYQICIYPPFFNLFLYYYYY